MAKDDKRNEFTLNIIHPDDGPTLSELNKSLKDWYKNLLITKEFYSGTSEGEVVPSNLEEEERE